MDKEQPEVERLKEALLDMYALFDLWMWHRPKNWTGSSWYGDCVENDVINLLDDNIPGISDEMSPEWQKRIRSRPAVEKYRKQ